MSKDTPRPTPKPLAHPVTTEVEYTAEEVDFANAMEAYRVANDRRFPTCREVLAVLISRGYRKVAAATPPPTFKRRVKPKGETERKGG